MWVCEGWGMCILKKNKCCHHGSNHNEETNAGGCGRSKCSETGKIVKLSKCYIVKLFNNLYKTTHYIAFWLDIVLIKREKSPFPWQSYLSIKERNVFE